LNDGENMLFILSVFMMKVNKDIVKLTSGVKTEYNESLRSLGESMQSRKKFLE